MQSFIDDLMQADPACHNQAARARLRVAVAEGLLLQMESLNLSKAQLAATLGVSRSAVSQALTGTRNMSLNLLADMATALKLTVEFVLEANVAAHLSRPRIALSEGSNQIRTTGNVSTSYEFVPAQTVKSVRVVHTGGSGRQIPSTADLRRISEH